MLTPRREYLGKNYVNPPILVVSDDRVVYDPLPLLRSSFLFGWAHDHPASFKETEDPYQILNIFGISTHSVKLISRFSYFMLLFERWC